MATPACALPDSFAAWKLGFVGHGQDGAGAEAPVAAEMLPPFFINEPRHRIGEMAFLRSRIRLVRTTNGVHVQHPAAAQQFHRVVEATGDQSQIAFRGAGSILAAHFPARQKRAVLIQDHAGLDERGIGKQVRQAFGFGAVVGELQHLKPPVTRQRLALAG